MLPCSLYILFENPGSSTDIIQTDKRNLLLSTLPLHFFYLRCFRYLVKEQKHHQKTYSTDKSVVQQRAATFIEQKVPHYLDSTQKERISQNQNQFADRNEPFSLNILSGAKNSPNYFSDFFGFDSKLCVTLQRHKDKLLNGSVFSEHVCYHRALMNINTREQH